MIYHLLQIAIFFLLFQESIVSAPIQKEYDLLSPDKSIQLTVSTGNKLTYSLRVDGNEVMGASKISMTIDDDQVLGKNPKNTSVNRKTINNLIKPVMWEKFRTIVDHFNEMTLEFADKYSISRTLLE